MIILKNEKLKNNEQNCSNTHISLIISFIKASYQVHYYSVKNSNQCVYHKTPELTPIGSITIFKLGAAFIIPFYAQSKEFASGR